MSRRLGKLATYGALVLASTVMLLPFLWLVAMVFKRPQEMTEFLFFPMTSLDLGPLGVWALPDPGRLSLANIRNLWQAIPFGRYMANSFFIAGAVTLLQMFFSSMAGFALAQYEFKGKRAVMFLMFATMIIPGQVTLAPMYELLYQLGWVDRLAGLIVPSLVSIFGIFLFRQSMLGIPGEILEAARMDGCGEFGLFWRIALPVSRPMTGAFCLIAFMGQWNSFLWPQIILHSQERFTLPIGLNSLVGTYEAQFGMMFAGTFLAVLPIMVLFFLLQKEFIAGLTAGAVKG